MKSSDRKYLPPRKAKIIESKYVTESDLIYWTLRFYDDGSEQSYVWPSVDLLKSLGITGKTSPEMLVKFCGSMREKDINFVIDMEPKKPEVEISKDQYEKLNQEMHKHFNNFRQAVQGE